MPFPDWLSRCIAPQSAPGAQLVGAPQGATPVSGKPPASARNVAPPGLDEIDFDQRIALWDRLIDAPGKDPSA
jgi:hypothetical protein